MEPVPAEQNELLTIIGSYESAKETYTRLQKELDDLYDELQSLLAEKNAIQRQRLMLFPIEEGKEPEPLDRNDPRQITLGNLQAQQSDVNLKYEKAVGEYNIKVAESENAKKHIRQWDDYFTRVPNAQPKDWVPLPLEEADDSVVIREGDLIIDDESESEALDRILKEQGEGAVASLRGMVRKRRLDDQDEPDLEESDEGDFPYPAEYEHWQSKMMTMIENLSDRKKDAVYNGAVEAVVEHKSYSKFKDSIPGFRTAILQLARVASDWEKQRPGKGYQFHLLIDNLARFDSRGSFHAGKPPTKWRVFFWAVFLRLLFPRIEDRLTENFMQSHVAGEGDLINDLAAALKRELNIKYERNALKMANNVWEWVRDMWFSYFDRAPTAEEFAEYYCLEREGKIWDGWDRVFINLRHSQTQPAEIEPPSPASPSVMPFKKRSHPVDSYTLTDPDTGVLTFLAPSSAGLKQGDLDMPGAAVTRQTSTMVRQEVQDYIQKEVGQPGTFDDAKARMVTNWSGLRNDTPDNHINGWVNGFVEWLDHYWWKKFQSQPSRQQLAEYTKYQTPDQNLTVRDWNTIFGSQGPTAAVPASVSPASRPPPVKPSPPRSGGGGGSQSKRSKASMTSQDYEQAVEEARAELNELESNLGIEMETQNKLLEQLHAATNEAERNLNAKQEDLRIAQEAFNTAQDALRQFEPQVEASNTKYNNLRAGLTRKLEDAEAARDAFKARVMSDERKSKVAKAQGEPKEKEEAYDGGESGTEDRGDQAAAQRSQSRESALQEPERKGKQRFQIPLKKFTRLEVILAEKKITLQQLMRAIMNHEDRVFKVYARQKGLEDARAAYSASSNKEHAKKLVDFFNNTFTAMEEQMPRTKKDYDSVATAISNIFATSTLFNDLVESSQEKRDDDISYTPTQSQISFLGCAMCANPKAKTKAGCCGQLRYCGQQCADDHWPRHQSACGNKNGKLFV
jgi:hypothetical protein